jgi:hypothetical protein
MVGVMINDNIGVSNNAIGYSTDYGYNFSQATYQGIPFGSATQFATNDSGSHFYATGNGLWGSSDYGRNWTSLKSGTFVSVCCDKTGQYIFACTSTTIYYSTNYGQTWTSKFDVTNWGVKKMACDANITKLAIIAYNGTITDGVYISYNPFTRITLQTASSTTSEFTDIAVSGDGNKIIVSSNLDSLVQSGYGMDYIYIYK